MPGEHHHKDLQALWSDRAKRLSDPRSGMSVVGMTRRPRHPEERRFLRSLGPEQHYGGLWFIEVEQPDDPTVSEVCRVLVARFRDDTEAYLRWLHTAQAQLGGDCPHELLARGEAEPVLSLLRQAEE